MVGGQASQAAKNTKTFARLVDRLDSNGRLTQASRYADAVRGRTTEPARRVTYRLGTQVARGSWAIGQRSGRRILSGVETAVETYRVGRRLDDADDSTLDDLNDLDQRDQRTSGRAIARTGDPEVASDGTGDLLELFREGDDIDPETVERLDDLRDAGELSDGEINDLIDAYDTGTIDGNDLRRVSKLLDDSNDEYLYDDDVDVNELLDIADETDLNEVHTVIEDADGDIRPLLRGQYNPDDTSVDSGWMYLKGRHIYGQQMNDPEKPATDFFPVGQTIKGRDLEPTEEMDTTDIKGMIYEAVKNSNTDQQDRITYELSSELESKTGVSTIRVIIRNGRVRQAYPTEGDAVHKWIQEVGEWKDRLEAD